MWTADEPLTGELATALDAWSPGIVKGGGKYFDYLDGAKRYREVDIVLDKFYFQVKSGKAGGMVAQIQATVKTLGKTTIGYALDMADGAMSAAAPQGVPIVRDFEGLIATMRELG